MKNIWLKGELREYLILCIEASRTCKVLNRRSESGSTILAKVFFAFGAAARDTFHLATQAAAQYSLFAAGHQIAFEQLHVRKHPASIIPAFF